MAAGRAGKPGQGRGGYAVGDARRARIVEVATREFAQHGYRGASIARIAESAGLSQPGLLHHFRTKERLLTAVLEVRDARDAERFFGEAGTRPRGLAAFERLQDLVDRNSREPLLVQLLAVLSTEAVIGGDPARRWLRERHRLMRTVITDGLREAADAGDLRPAADPDTQADRLIALLDGLRIQWLLDPDRVDMARIFRLSVDDLITSLRLH
ncbi:MAG: TetR/AcrR family transcriptional regulator [Streptosporangiaceae bacterium]